jgi:type 1 glutamine amidotransferase
MKIHALIMAVGLCSLAWAQQLTPEEKQQVDQALPQQAQARPKRPRRLLICTLTMRDGKPTRSSSYAAAPIAAYAFEQMGRRTGAYEAVFRNDVEVFRPASLKQFDGICFLNTMGVLFDDPELRKSLLDFIAGGKGFAGIHDAIATFVQYPDYDQWPPFGQMLGGTENGGHPWNGVPMMVKLDDPRSLINAAFDGQEFEVTDQAFQLQEPVLRDHLHVLLSIDAGKTPMSPRAHLLPQRAQDKDFPVSWTRQYSKGRVFYCSLGHGAAMYCNPMVLRHYLAGIQYALGDLKADSTPSAQWAKK